MLKKISLLILLFVTLKSFSVSYTTVTDECPYIRFSGTTLRDIVIDKSQIKLQQTNNKVIVVFLSGGSQTLSWDSVQARSYGYSLDSLYDYILSIEKIQCDTSGGGSNNIYKNGLTKSNDTVYGGGQITDLSYSNSTDLLFNLDSTGQLYLPKIDTYTPSSEILIDSFPSATRNAVLDSFVNLLFSGDYTKLCFGDSTGTADKIRRRDYDKLVLDTLNFPACTSGQEGFTMLQFKFSNAVIPDGYYIDSFSVIFSGYDTLNCGGNINLSNVQSPYWSIYDGNHFITPDNFSFFAEKLDNPLVSGSDTIGLMNAHFDTATTNIDSLVISVLLPLYQDYQILTPLTHDYKGLYDKIYIRYKLNPIVNNLIIIGNQVFKTTYSVPNLVIYKTKAEMDVIKTNNELVAGSYYLISGVHPTLYDDGTTSGSSILLQALDSNTLSKDGQGLFYNPPYKIGVAGHGVTDTSSTYSIGDTSFWGGYVWVCNTNGQAVATDVLNLDGNWTKLTYSSGAYNSVFDVISYDYSNDVIVRRYEADKDNDVIFTKEDDINMGLGYNAIQVFMFGNLNNDNVGIHGNKIINSYFECVNFRGTKINLNNLTHNSSISNNHYTISSDLYLNTLENAVVTNNYNLRFGNNNLTTSVIDNNKFILNSYMSGNSCINSYMSNNYLYNSNILENILVVTSSITDDSLVSSYISSNNLSAGFITGLSLKNGSYVDNNLIRNSEVTTGTLNSSRITKNNFETISFVNYFTLTVNSAISYNNLKNSTITDVIADSTSYFIYNTLENSSIESFELSYNSYIMKNNMYNALFQSLTSAPLSSKVIEGVVFERAEILATDFSSATNIFGTYSKWIFSRADGTPRLKYYNNLDLPVIVNVDN